MMRVSFDIWPQGFNIRGVPTDADVTGVKGYVKLSRTVDDLASPKEEV